MSWDFDFPLWIGQPQFDAQVNKFERGRRFASVVTLNNHPLSGYRFWEVQAAVGNAHDFVIRTGAVEHPTFANDRLKALLAGDSLLKSWTALFQTILTDTRGVTVAGPMTVLGGAWDNANIPAFQALVGWKQSND